MDLSLLGARKGCADHKVGRLDLSLLCAREGCADHKVGRVDLSLLGAREEGCPDLGILTLGKKIVFSINLFLRLCT